MRTAIGIIALVAIGVVTIWYAGWEMRNSEDEEDL